MQSLKPFGLLINWLIYFDIHFPNSTACILYYEKHFVHTFLWCLSKQLSSIIADRQREVISRNRKVQLRRWKHEDTCDWRARGRTWTWLLRRSSSLQRGKHLKYLVGIFFQARSNDILKMNWLFETGYTLHPPRHCKINHLKHVAKSQHKNMKTPENPIFLRM